jgi:hypothetical protein
MHQCGGDAKDDPYFVGMTGMTLAIRSQATTNMPIKRYGPSCDPPPRGSPPGLLPTVHSFNVAYIYMICARSKSPREFVEVAQ